MQLTAFAHGIMMLLLLAVVRNDLLNDWRRSLPADTPNFFFINIPPDEHQAFTKFLEERGAQHARARPMVRARMTHINGKPIDDIKFATRRGREFANRDQNITWAEALGRDNEITAGRWFTPEDFGKPLVSVSTEYMEEMNLKLGDELQFDIAGETRTAQDIERARGEVGQLPAELLPDVRAGPARGLAGHLDDGGAPRRPTTRKPSPTWCGASRASRCSTSTTCCARCARSSTRPWPPCRASSCSRCMAGLVVLIAAVQASREERRYESAMLRTLGANRSTVLKGLLAEFAALGVLSGTLAAAGASIAGVYIATQVLQIPVHAGPVGVDLRPGGRRLASLPRGLAGHAFGGEPAARAHLAERVMAKADRSRAGRWWAGTTRACSRTRPTRWPSPTSSAAIRIRGSSKRSRASRRTNSTIRAAQGDFWFDYVADIGDGWNPTYAIADAIAQPELTLRTAARGEDASRPRAGVRRRRGLSLSHAHANTTCAPKLLTRMAFAGRAHPDVFAIPGNHDWYDSLVAFSRTFCRPERGFAGCPTRQTRSYFALQLPANWWLLAIDLQLGADLDEPQVQYFQKVAARMDDAARLIFCVPEPRWILEDAYPSHSSYEELSSTRFLEEKVFKRKARVFLTGDLHFYKRHENAEGIQKITSGGGGAFLHPDARAGDAKSCAMDS